MFNSYAINWRLFIKRNTPLEMRDSRTLSWIYCLMHPLKTLHELFLSYREEVLFRVQFHCQVIYLEKALNDKFNGGLPAYTGETSTSEGTPAGIYIDNPGDRLPIPYLFRTEEGKDNMFLYRIGETITDPLDQAYLYRTEEYENPINYIIYVPFALGDVVADQTLYNNIKAFANLYRPAAKHFSIINY